jgi:hypothetical protein
MMTILQTKPSLQLVNQYLAVMFNIEFLPVTYCLISEFSRSSFNRVGQSG